MNLLKDLAKASGNELAGVVSDGIVAGDVVVISIQVLISLMH